MSCLIAYFSGNRFFVKRKFWKEGAEKVNYLPQERRGDLTKRDFKACSLKPIEPGPICYLKLTSWLPFPEVISDWKIRLLYPRGAWLKQILLELNGTLIDGAVGTLSIILTSLHLFRS